MNGVQGSSSSRLVRALFLEVLQSLAVLLVAVSVLLLILSFNSDEFSFFSSWTLWTQDSQGLPLTESFPPRAIETLKLVSLALLIALPLSLWLALLCASSKALRPLRLALGLVSAMPAFVLAYALLDDQWPQLWAALTLAVADLSLSSFVGQLTDTLSRELNSDHARAARSRGASLLRELWRPVVVSMLLSLRTRLPVLFAATVVAERIFNIPGLGDQASYAVLELPDPIFLFWFAVLSVVVTRLVLVFARALEALLIPPAREHSLSQVEWGSLITQLWAADSRPLASVRAEDLPEPPAKTWRQTLSQSVSKVGKNFALADAPWASRVSAWLLMTPVWLGVLVIAFGALSIDSQSLYGESGHLAMSGRHWLGTDGLERDVFVQICLGARLSFPWWCLAVLIPTLLGLVTGTLSALSPRAAVFQYLLEALDALPKLVVVLLAMSVLGVDSYLTLGLPLMGLLFSPYVHEHVKARVQSLVDSRFVEAEQVAGASWPRTLFLHIVWSHCRAVVLSRAAVVFGGVVLLDATCGYLQIAQRDLFAWGALVYDNVQAWNMWYGLDQPFNTLSVFAPMFASTAVILVFSQLGEALAALSRTGQRGQA